VIDRLQHALIAKGYVTSRVLATAQDLTSGRLVLQVLPGRISEIKWAEGSGHRSSRWNTVPIRAGDVLNLRDIEQALENVRVLGRSRSSKPESRHACGQLMTLMRRPPGRCGTGSASRRL
jgi:hemolysin activation/secretion protein